MSKSCIFRNQIKGCQETIGNTKLFYRGAASATRKNGTTQRPNFPCISQHFQGVVSQPRDTTRSALWKKHQLASKCCACHEKTYYTLRAVTKWRFWTTVKYCPRPYYTLGAVVKRKFCKILSFHIQRILLMFNL